MESVRRLIRKDHMESVDPLIGKVRKAYRLISHNERFWNATERGNELFGHTFSQEAIWEANSPSAGTKRQSATVVTGRI